MGANATYNHGLWCPYCQSGANKVRLTGSQATQDGVLGSTIEWYNCYQGCKRTFLVVREGNIKGGNIVGVFQRPEDWRESPSKIPAKM